MSEQAKRAEIQRYSHGGSRADAMQKINCSVPFEDPNGEWVFYEDHAAALQEAERRGVEKMRDAALADARMEVTEIYELGALGKAIRTSAARLLSEDMERRCILCKVPLVVGPPTCPRCGGHAWKEDSRE